MVALATDKLLKVGNPGSATTLSAPGYTIGATSITVGSTSNWPTDTGVVFAIDEAQVVNGVEVQVAGTYNEYVGVVSSGTSVTSVAWKVGVGDRNYASGALTRVYIPVSAERENRIVEWGTAQHNQDGSHGVVTATSLTSASGLTVTAGAVSLPAGSLATAALASGSVTNAKLSTTSGEPGGAWTSWSPTFTGFTIGNGTVTARYTLIGKTVHARFHILYGSTTQITGDFGISNPVTAAANAGTGNITPRGQFIAFNGGTIHNGVMGNTSTTATNMRFIVASGTYASLFIAPNSTTPFASVAGVEIAGEFTYEAA